jgi:hypothetical protein
VLFADAANGVVAAAHAGWKGALGGVLENTLAVMESLGARRATTVAAIGPCIRRASYEVQNAFAEPFLAHDPAAERFFAAGRPGHLQFDLPGYCLARLAAAGVPRIEDCGLDTYADARFFSYRRATHAGAPITAASSAWSRCRSQPVRARTGRSASGTRARERHRRRLPAPRSRCGSRCSGARASPAACPRPSSTCIVTVTPLRRTASIWLMNSCVRLSSSPSTRSWHISSHRASRSSSECRALETAVCEVCIQNTCTKRSSASRSAGRSATAARKGAAAIRKRREVAHLHEHLERGRSGAQQHFHAEEPLAPHDTHFDTPAVRQVRHHRNDTALGKCTYSAGSPGLLSTFSRGIGTRSKCGCSAAKSSASSPASSSLRVNDCVCATNRQLPSEGGLRSGGTQHRPLELRA